MKLSVNTLRDLEAAGISLPKFDRAAMCAATEKAPAWVHFGAGNIFRGFIANLQQSLLDQGLSDTGIIAAETFDTEIIDKIYDPFDNLTLLATLLADGSTENQAVASIAKGLRANMAYPQDMERLREIFRSPTLQMVSFTITEKGYAIKDLQGEYLPPVQAGMAAGPKDCGHAMSLTASLLYERWQAGGAPIAIVSMDNCSHNGEKLRDSVMQIARAWLANGLVSQEYLSWLGDEEKVSFPWSVIDKITPRPSGQVERALTALGLEDMAPIVTGKGTYIAPFVNAEQPQYLVVEDRFPNGRPALERAGVYMTDRDTVNLTERMKVTTCLNPLHTALAVMGCLLGYTSIAAEMGDRELKTLVERIGYREGLPVVTDPGIIKPKDFLDEVINSRLPNPFIPDTPQRIATDTSQKVGIRFGETIKSYGDRAGELTYIPLAIAGWLRYLLGEDDNGDPMECSPDPMLETLRSQLAGVRLSEPDTASDEVLRPILANAALFGADLVQAGLAPKIGGYLRSMLAGPGAVRETLRQVCG